MTTSPHRETEDTDSAQIVVLFFNQLPISSIYTRRLCSVPSHVRERMQAHWQVIALTHTTFANVSPFTRETFESINQLNLLTQLTRTLIRLEQEKGGE